jgi:hypothetical protein
MGVQRYGYNAMTDHIEPMDVGILVKYDDYLALQKQLHDLEDAVRYVSYTNESLEDEYRCDNGWRIRNGMHRTLSLLYQAIKNSEARQ